MGSIDVRRDRESRACGGDGRESGDGKSLSIWRVMFLALGLLWGSPAYALEGRLEDPGHKIFVWKNAEAHTEAIRLIKAGVYSSNPSLITSLLSCLVESGTKVIATSMGFATHDILVIDGPNAGCRGNVAAERFKTR